MDARIQLPPGEPELNELEVSLLMQRQKHTDPPSCYYQYHLSIKWVSQRTQVLLMYLPNSLMHLLKSKLQTTEVKGHWCTTAWRQLSDNKQHIPKQFLWTPQLISPSRKRKLSGAVDSTICWSSEETFLSIRPAAPQFYLPHIGLTVGTEQKGVQTSHTPAHFPSMCLYPASAHYL